MQGLKTLDVEDAIRQDLGGLLSGYTAIASPVPETLGANLPLVVVYRLGGSRTSRVIDEHDLSIDVYAKRWSLAMDAANTAVAALESLADSDPLTSGVDWLDAYVTTFPYNNPDPDHEDIPRVTFAATVICRPEVINL